MTNETEEYLSALYGDIPDGYLWIGGHANGFGPNGHATIGAAAASAQRQAGLLPAGIYHRGTTLQAPPAKGRGRDEDSASVYFFAADVDIAGPGHKATNLPPHAGAARAALAESGFPDPTAWVSSGGGLYPQWWLDEPIDVRHPDDLARVRAAFQQLQNHLAACWEDRGWKLDPVADMSRVWRLPGTMNRKVAAHPTPCTWSGLPDMRYHLDDLLPNATRTPAAKAVRPAAIVTPANGTTVTSSSAPWEHSRASREVAKWLATVDRAAHDAGDFNNTLVRAATRIGHFVPSLGDFESAKAALMLRCAAIWGQADGNDVATIESGLRHGMTEPYRVVADIPLTVTALDPALLPPPPAPDAGAFPPALGIDLDALLEELRGYGDQDKARVRAREAIAQVGALLTPDQRAEWRDRLKTNIALGYGQFDEQVKRAETAARSAQIKAAAIARAGEEIDLPQPDAPLRVARKLCELQPDVHRKFWRDDFYTWDGTRYRITPTADIRTWVYLRTENATFTTENADGMAVTKAWNPNTTRVNQVVDALGHAVFPHPSELDQVECIALTNGVLDPVSRALAPHDPERFNITSLPYAYDPSATCPRWLAFLAEVLPADSAQFLQEWMGYLISGRTNMHKIASLVGASRSGKGTIARVITALLGKENVAGPVLAQLVGPFGLEPLLGKSLAVFGDVKWNAKGVADATELLKTISGDDATSVHRKNRAAWEGHLPTRFMTLSNNTPTFIDESGALAGRMIHVRFTRSFAGQENVHLTDELLAELPGVLLWALDGLVRLDAQGRFTVPADSREVDEEVRRDASPKAAFVADRCVLDPAARVELSVLWAAWVSWCGEEGDDPGQQRWFVRNVKDSVTGVGTTRTESGGRKTKWVTGLSLRNAPGTPLAFPEHVSAVATGG